MGWLGGCIGIFLGSLSRIPFGGIIGGIIGAVIEEKLKYSSDGNYNEETLERMRRTREARTARTRTAQTREERRRREIVFLTAASAMFAKMAKADGRVTADEIACVEEAFRRLGFTGEKRDFCISVFRKAKDDGLTIYAYAAEFASCEPQAAVRETLYSMLWDLACADGHVSPEEREILANIVRPLRLDPRLYAWHSARRGHADGQARAEARSDPYETLGVRRDMTNDELRAAYRDKAKRLHPDILRAQGLSEELMGKANEQMSRINAAWDEIKRERGIG